MITNICMLFVLTIIVLIGLYGASIKQDETFFSKNDTIYLKGILCFIVMFVHVPIQYTNTIQDMIGSFAFIAVSMFFMISSYGLMLNYSKNSNNRLSFFIKRILKLLLPALIINIINCLIHYLDQSYISDNYLQFIFYLNKWLTMFLIVNIIFFIIKSLIKDKKIADMLLITIPILYCIYNLTFCNSIINYWPIESLGFSIGIILYKNKTTVDTFISNHWLKNFLISFIFAFTFGLLYVLLKNNIIHIANIFKVLLEISFIYMVLTVLKKINLGNKVSFFLGKISYEFYLIHEIIFYFCQNIIKINNSGIFIIISIILIIIISAIVNYICEIILKKAKVIVC